MGLLQIDTISVVARSPYLVLFSRLGAYQSGGWSRRLPAASCSNIGRTKPVSCRLMILVCCGTACWRLMIWAGNIQPTGCSSTRRRWTACCGTSNNRGRCAPPISAPKKGNSGWWDWKPEKRHLEILFTAGKLMVAERRNFHRVYDLTERLLPAWDDARHTLPAEQRAGDAAPHLPLSGYLSR